MKVCDVKKMTKSMSKRQMLHTINLAEIEGDGSFPCPKCATVISPEDESEKVYKIVDTKLVNDELVELIVMCEKCKSNIKLTGFQATI